MTPDLRPYPEYRDSGIPWLGTIPKHWGVARSKLLFTERKERALPDDEQLSATQSHGVIRQSDYERHIGRKLTRILLHLEKRRHVEKDDFVISMRSFQGGLERAWCRGAIRSSYVVLKPGPEVHVPYFAHLFKSHSYIQALRATSDFIRDGQDLTFWNFCLVDLPVVPADEQKAIASYLDSNAERVRRFIRNRRRLIEVLNEQKQAIIDRAITRGLDPNVRLKPSGIDWLGDVPEHWELRRLKYLVQNINEQTSSLRNGDLYVALEHVESWTGRLALPDGEVSFDSQVKRFREGDILFGKLRPYLAKVTRPQQAGVCVGEFLVLRPSDTTVLPNFLEQKLRSKQIIDLVNSSTFGAKMPRADWTFIGNVQIAFSPSHDEQAAILDRIARETATLSSAIERTQREIALVQEYRTRLIADVVTGKVDVRHLAPHPDPLPQGEREEEDEAEDMIDGPDAGDLEPVEEMVDADD